MVKKMDAITVRLSSEAKTAIKRISKTTGTSMSAIVIYSIDDYLRHGEHAAINKIEHKKSNRTLK